MFTGLVEKIGTLETLQAAGEGGSLTIRHSPWDSPLTLGESIAVQGTCLSVTAMESNRFTCDVLEETLARTNLRSKEKGGPLNLERAMPASGRFGGHFVTGHIDGQAVLADRRAVGRDFAMTFEADPSIMDTIVQKGSVCCDGISLTVAAVTPQSFDVHLIPQTLADTSLDALRKGDSVNIETDILGKYVHKYVAAASDSGSLSLDDLKQAGFE